MQLMLKTFILFNYITYFDAIVTIIVLIYYK